jgi:hypothetical protein
MVLEASDGNLWIADPPQESVYLDHDQRRAAANGLFLRSRSSSAPDSGIQRHPGTTGEPNPAYGDAGTVFSLNAGLPPR